MRLLFTTAPLRGHLFPLVPLAWAARSAGHDVLVATTEDFVPVVLGAGLPAVAWGPPTDVTEIAARIDERPPALGRAFARVATRTLAGARALVSAWRPDVVVAERAEYAGPVAAAGHDVPYVRYHWGLAPLPEYVDAARAELGVDRLPEPVLTVDPWPAALRLPHAAGHHGVRAVPYNGDARLEEWLLTPPSRPRVCVTLGTVLPALAGDRTRADLGALVAAVSALGAEPVVAGRIDPAVWPELAERGARVGHVSLSHLLPHCAAMVSHGGQGTVLTALHTGCPQIVLPHLDDQFDTADAVAGCGAGLRLAPADATPAAVADACGRLLADAAYRGSAVKVAAEIAAEPAPTDVVRTLEALVRR